MGGQIAPIYDARESSFPHFTSGKFACHAAALTAYMTGVSGEKAKVPGHEDLLLRQLRRSCVFRERRLQRLREWSRLLSQSCASGSAGSSASPMQELHGARGLQLGPRRGRYRGILPFLPPESGDPESGGAGVPV